ncbi:hypothetical protein U14_00407 [Candidatus Moduliflexus flocculans]|uniref:Uncharacterized protein n=1 Tax=Candidatus Moduliflexus flocculans TaxID=1499966 RepID=A0A0S6VQ21_9BACT|nr:hypothetical protein U14_00407 [Candidatus Moduliflexus flocculans]
MKVAQNANRARQDLPVDRFNLLSVPIVSKFDAGEEFKIGNKWLERIAEKVPEIYASWLPEKVNIFDFLQVTKLPYKPYFSFGEELAVVKEGTNDPTGLGYAYESLAALLANKLENGNQLLDDRNAFIETATRKGRLLKSKKQARQVSMFADTDLLVIDDQESWRDLIIELFDNIYTCDVADCYEVALEKIHTKNYRVICTNLGIERAKPDSVEKGRSLLTVLKDQFPLTPVILLTGRLVGSPEAIKERYPNIKRIIYKGQQPFESTYQILEEFEEIIPKLIEKSLFNNRKSSINGTKMFTDTTILELLTTKTIKAVVPFLINQFSKLTYRINEEQLYKIQQKAQTAKTDQDVEDVKQFIQKVVPDANQIASVAAFTAWVEKEVDASFDDLPGVSELVVRVLREKKNSESNVLKKDRMLKMEAALKTEIKEFDDAYEIGDVGQREKRNLFDRMIKALDFIKD